MQNVAIRVPTLRTWNIFHLLSELKDAMCLEVPLLPWLGIEERVTPVLSWWMLSEQIQIILPLIFSKECLSAISIKAYVCLSRPENRLRWSMCIFRHDPSRGGNKAGIRLIVRRTLPLPFLILFSISQKRLIPWAKKPYDGM